MGFLLIDHTEGQGIDGKSGTKLEMDTRSCGHCGALIAVLSRPHEKVYLSSMDLAVLATTAADRGHEYVAKYRCSKCKTDVCRACAKLVSETHRCESLKQHIDSVFEHGRLASR